MGANRRTVLGAALTAPLLAQFVGTASAAADEKWGTISDGWIEVRWTEQVQAELKRLGAEIEAVAPAELITDSGGSAVRFPVRSANGDPSLRSLPKAEGEGLLEGGITVRTPTANARVVDLQSVLQDGTASGKCSVNGVDVGHRSVFRCDLSDGLLTTGDVPVGRPLKVRINNVPLRPTPEALEVYTATFGTPVFTADTLLAHVTAEGVYTPPNS